MQLYSGRRNLTPDERADQLWGKCTNTNDPTTTVPYFLPPAVGTPAPLHSQHALGETQVALATAFGVSFQHVSDIVNRKRWTHL